MEFMATQSSSNKPELDFSQNFSVSTNVMLMQFLEIHELFYSLFWVID